MNLTLGKDKRLKSKKKIQRLFESGQRIKKYPISAIYFIDPSSNQFELAVSVPKKLHKKAVHRNLLKRRMREAFRLHQGNLKINGKLEVMLIYTSNEICDFEKIEKSVLYIISSLNSLSNEDI